MNSYLQNSNNISSNDSTHRGCTVKYASKLRFSGAAIEVLFLFFSWPLYPSASFLAFAAFSALSSQALNNIVNIHVVYSYLRKYVITIDNKLTNQSNLFNLEVTIKIFQGYWQNMSSLLTKPWVHYSISGYNWFIGVWGDEYENQKSNILFLLY